MRGHERFLMEYGRMMQSQGQERDGNKTGVELLNGLGLKWELERGFESRS